MRAVNVWAWHEQHTRPGAMQRAPICSDASASTARMGTALAGRLIGAAGWHFAFPFSSLSDLADKLETATLPDHVRGESRTLQRGEVQSLAIDCHGSDGVFYPNGLPGTGVTARNLDRYGESLRRIGLMTASRRHEADVPNPPSRFMRRDTVGPSTILLVCCNTGAGPRGTALLEQLSYRWPHRRVVGFSTTVVIPNIDTVQDPATGEACVAPFSLDSGQHGMRLSQSDEWMEEFRRTHGQNPSSLPFADATAENAKIAVDGRIVDRPANELQRGASLAPQFNGPPRGNTARPSYSPQGRRRLA